VRHTWIVNHVWKIFFTYELSIYAYNSIVISRVLVFFSLSKPTVFPYAKDVFVSHLARERFQGPWRLNGVDVLKRDDALSRSPKEQTLDLCRLNETTSAALSFANDINAFSDSVFDLAFPDICDELFPRAKQRG